MLNNYSTKSNIKYKLLSIDLDGTLLNKIKKISRQDLLALKHFNKSNGIIFINTGKNLAKTIRIVNKLNNYLIHKIRYFSCLNGNIIYDLETNKIIKQNVIEKKDVLEVFNIVKKANLLFCCYQKINNQIKYLINKINYKNDNTYKINIISLFKKICKYDQIINELEKNQNLELLKTNNHLYEIVKKNCNKAYALNFICHKLNININNVASIGDSYNDLSMFNLNNNAFLIKHTNNEILKKASNYYLELKKNKIAYVINNFIFI